MGKQIAGKEKAGYYRLFLFFPLFHFYFLLFLFPPAFWLGQAVAFPSGTHEADDCHNHGETSSDRHCDELRKQIMQAVKGVKQR